MCVFVVSHDFCQCIPQKKNDAKELEYYLTKLVGHITSKLPSNNGPGLHDVRSIMASLTPNWKTGAFCDILYAMKHFSKDFV